MFRVPPTACVAVDIFDRTKCTRGLEDMVEALKGAVAMGICVCQNGYFVSLYCPCARNRLFAVTMSEQSQTRTIGSSVWLGIDRYAAVFKRGTTRDFGFCFAGERRHEDMALHTFVRNLGLSIAQNANSVECLRLEAGPGEDMFKKLFSLDEWKEAFPSLQRAYFIGNVSALIHVSQYLMKHVRGLEHLYLWHDYHRGKFPQRYMDWIGNTIRNNAIEEVEFFYNLLDDDTLLDDTLRSVRSFHVEIDSCSTSLHQLVGSFERTKAEGDKLERLSVRVLYSSLSPMDSFSATALDTILRSRPRLRVLNLTSH